MNLPPDPVGRGIFLAMHRANGSLREVGFLLGLRGFTSACVAMRTGPLGDFTSILRASCASYLLPAALVTEPLKDSARNAAMDIVFWWLTQNAIVLHITAILDRATESIPTEIVGFPATMHKFLPVAYFQNRFVPFEEANLSIATHALHYGTGAFGGMRGIPDPSNPRQILLFRLDRHCKRLSDSARFLNHDLPADKIEAVLVEFIKQNQPTTSFYIRPFVYTSDLGIAPRLHNIEKSFFVYGLELGDYLSPDGVSCRVSSWHRQEDRSLPLRGKISGAYITSSLAKTEAVEAGFDEAILLNSQGKVCEASGMNIFIVRDGTLITPGPEQDILEGITRSSILTIARDIGIEYVERPVDKTELLIADEVFLSGTAAKITPVKRIENYTLSTNRPIMTQLRQTLTAITENRELAYQDWVSVVPLD